MKVLVAPTTSEVVSAVEPMPQGILVTMLDNVRGRLYRIQPVASGVRREPIPFPDNGALRMMSKR